MVSQEVGLTDEQIASMESDSGGLTDEQIASMEQPKENRFVPSENGVVRNILDPFMQAGIETAKGYHSGAAAVVTPGAMLLKALQVPEEYNIFEQSRKYEDSEKAKLPETNLDPVSKFLFKEGASAPGYMAAFEQVAPALKPVVGAVGKGAELLKQFIGADKKLAESAYQTALKSRPAFKSWAKDMSDRFGVAWEKAIGKNDIGIEELGSILETTADEAGILGKEASQLSMAERKFLKYKDAIYEQVGKKDRIPLSEVDKEMKNLIGTKFGKAWGQGDHILNLTRKNVGGAIAERAPEVGLVKTKFAPELQFKAKAIKVLEPWRPEGAYEAEKGISFFEDAAKGKLRPDDAKFLGDITKNYSKGLLDDLMAKGKIAKIANITGKAILGTGLLGGTASGLDLLSKLGKK